MDEQKPKKPQPKISLIIGGGVLVVFIVLDIIDIALKFFALDDFLIIDTISYLFLVPFFVYYKYMKGADFSGNTVIMNLAELIPYIGALPLRSISLGIVLWIDRHPEGKLAKKIHLAAKVLPARKGAVAKGGQTNGVARSKSAQILANADSKASEKYEVMKKRKSLEARKNNPLNQIPNEYSKETGNIPEFEEDFDISKNYNGEDNDEVEESPENKKVA